MATSSDSTVLIKEIGEVLKNAQNELTVFKKAITNKHVVVFLGNTRSGKSTLVNYIIGTKLESFEERSPIYKIRKVNELDDGPEIGQGSQSCTTIPSLYRLNDLDIVVIDAPGFDDNRNESQDIVNALYINQVKYAKTVKFVLVSDINELLIDNIKGFTDLLEKVHSLFPNIENIKTSVSIVFTKDYRNYLQADIALLLRRKILAVDDLAVNKQFVEYLAENEGIVAFFRMPTAPGPVTSEIDTNIENARVTSCALPLFETYFKTALSSKSRLVLIKIYEKYLDSAYFEQELQRILVSFSNFYIIDDYVFASTDDELEDSRDTLRHLVNLFNQEYNKHFSNMSDIGGSLRRILNSNISREFLGTLEALVMIDRNMLMEDTIRNKFVRKYENSLRDIREKVNKLVCKIDKEIEGRRKDRLLFNTSAAVAGGAGSASLAAGILNRVVEVSRVAPFGIVGILGSIVTAVGAGVAATSYVVQNERNKKRIQARRRQNRVVEEDMFHDD